MNKDEINLVIYKRKDTKKTNYGYSFEAPPVDGKRKRIRKTGFATQKEARAAGRKAIDEYYPHLAKDGIDYDKITFQEYTEKVWRPQMDGIQVNAATMHGYNKLLKRLFVKFGNMRLRGIDIDDIKTYFDNEYINEDTKTNTVGNMRALMSQIYRFAVLRKHVQFSPLECYEKPNVRLIPAKTNKNEKYRNAIPSDILAKIYERFPNGTEEYYHLKVSELTGVRHGELYGLCWEDIDLENKKVIYLTRQLQRFGDCAAHDDYEKKLIEQYPELAECPYAIRNPKYNSKRIIPISLELEELLREMKAQQERNSFALGPDYVRYYYTRRKAPDYAGRSFQSFNLVNEVQGYLTDGEFENGIVNAMGVGYPLSFVFVNAFGKLRSPSFMDEILKDIHGKKKEPVISAEVDHHSFRHTFATNLENQGVPRAMVSAIMGHDREETTETYIDMLEENFMAIAVQAFRGGQQIGQPEWGSAEHLSSMSKDELEKIRSQIDTLLSGSQIA